MAHYRETLHDLNRRYKEAWDRAERLEAELEHVKKSRAYRLLTAWRRWSGLFRKSACPLPENVPSFTQEYFDDLLGQPVGTVSVIIPFKNRLDLLKNCVESLFAASRRPTEIVLVDNGSTCVRTLDYLNDGQRLARFKVISCPGPFNFSRLCNAGAGQAAALTWFF